MRTPFLTFSLLSLLLIGGATTVNAQSTPGDGIAKKAAATIINQITAQNAQLPVAPDPTPLPTAEPTPLPTAVPTPVPTAVPTAIPTVVPTPVVTTPTGVGTPNPIPVQTSAPISGIVIKTPVTPGARSDVSVITPYSAEQQVQQAAQSIQATRAPEGDRVLLNIASRINSSTLSEPSSNYTYDTFSGLNHSLTLGLDTFAAVLAAAGIYVAVRSGSTMHV